VDRGRIHAVRDIRRFNSNRLYGFEVRFVGRVVQVVRCPTKVDFELDDGTGSISCIYWYVKEHVAIYDTRHIWHAMD